MPTFISNPKGLWFPAKEKVGGLIYKGKKPIAKEKLPASVLISGEVLNPGDPFIYDGIDREALRMLQDQGYDMGDERVMGVDFTRSPEFLQSIRNQGFNSVEEYLTHLGFDQEKAEKEFKKKAAKVKSHEVTERVAEIKVLAGGRNTAGTGEDIVGGFGEERIRPAKEVEPAKK